MITCCGKDIKETQKLLDDRPIFENKYLTREGKILKIVSLDYRSIGDVWLKFDDGTYGTYYSVDISEDCELLISTSNHDLNAETIKIMVQI